MNKWKLLIVFFSTVLISCNSAKQQSLSNNKEKVIDVRLSYHSMRLIWADNDDRDIRLEDDDRIKLAKYLFNTKYDTEWNDSGIMLKMVAPDYTLSLSRVAIKDDLLMIWRENNKVKFDGIWYIISEDVSEDVYRLLDKYIE